MLETKTANTGFPNLVILMQVCRGELVEEKKVLSLHIPVLLLSPSRWVQESAITLAGRKTSRGNRLSKSV